MDERDLRRLAEAVLRQLDVLVDEPLREAVEAEIRRALALPEGTAAAALGLAMSRHPAVRAWVHLHRPASQAESLPDDRRGVGTATPEWLRGSRSGRTRASDLQRQPAERYLAVELPERAPVEARVGLIVSILLTPPEGAAAKLKPFQVVPEGSWITISVSAPALIPLGDLEHEVLVPPDADSEPVRFAFVTGAPGLHTVVVRAFAAGTFLGELRVQISVEQGASLVEGPARVTELGLVPAEPGEVTLVVERQGDHYSFRLMPHGEHRPELLTRLAGDPSRAVEALFAELRDMAAGQTAYASSRLVERRLRNLGAQLWADAVPEAIRRQFWEIADRITSFSILSNLDTVPWELLYPVDGDNDAGGFLAQRFPVLRRVDGQGQARQLALSGAAFVVPPNSPSDAMDEVAAVRARLGGAVSNRGVLEQLPKVLALLDDPGGVIHFVCHNSFTADGSVVRMAEGPFRPSDLAFAVQRKALAAASPLVFFNACRSAGEIPGFTKMVGWATQFMRAGAGAFVGSLWSVRSGSARRFADAFYRALANDGRSLGEASLAARAETADETADPTWLAYTVYGNPKATVVTGG